MKRLLFFICVLVSISAYSQEKRLALVIGNSAYEYGGILKNPVNDAYAMKRVLSDIGFDVLEYYNLNQGDMKKAIDDFGVELRRYDVGLFFYAGHGLQANGYNYLIPVDANLMSERYVEYDCVQADRVLGNMDASDAAVKIVILDACRNNPFERSWTRSASGSGLAFMNAPKGSLIAYATAPGSTASDGEGKNGLYTEAILENIKKANITVLQVFQNVRSLVSQRTGNRQVPWESTSLTGDYYFNNQQIQQPISTIDSSLISNQIETDTPLIFDENDTSGIFADQRDGNEYKWVRIGEQVWMAENLNYEISDNWIHDTIYGRLYSPEAANAACPDGWHLPSDEEWMELEMYLGMLARVENRGYRGTIEGGKLKEKGTTHWLKTNVYTTNESGFSALPGGIRFSFGGISGIQREAYFWTSTKESTAYYCRHLNYRRNTIRREFAYKSNGLSVRCVKDSPLSKY
jgi:uncharacterized protein (TIGR02145 family)